MTLKDRHHSVTVRGLVCPSDWDEDNQPSRVSIFTFDDDEYEVDPRDAGLDLMEKIGQEVMARGHVLPGYRRRKILLIRSFTVSGADLAESIENSSPDPVPPGPGS